MADNNREEFVLPSIYSQLEGYLNKNFYTSETLSHEQAANDYIKQSLNKSTSGRNPTIDQYILEEALTFLPDSFRRKGVLSNIDVRPLLLAFKDYVAKGNFIDSPKRVDGILSAVNKNYNEVADAYVSMDGVTGNQKETAVKNFLNNTNGFSPHKYAAEKAAGGATPEIDTETNAEGKGPISRDAPGYEPYSGTATSGTSTASITPQGEFIRGDISVGEKIDYTQYLQEHATATIDDLQALEESGEPTQSNVFKAGEFITNLTGKVTGVNWADPLGGQTTWSLGQAISYVNNLTTPQITKLQKSLRDSGYFDKLAAYPNEGVADEATRMAWNMFLTDTVRNNQTPAGRLKAASDEFAKRMASGQGNLFMDEASVESAALAVGSKVLGRGLDKSELDTLTAAVRNWERDAYKTKATGTGIEGDLFSQVDIENRINRYMQTTYEDETTMNSLPENIEFLKSVFG